MTDDTTTTIAVLKRLTKSGYTFLGPLSTTDAPIRFTIDSSTDVTREEADAIERTLNVNESS